MHTAPLCMHACMQDGDISSMHMGGQIHHDSTTVVHRLATMAGRTEGIHLTSASMHGSQAITHHVQPHGADDKDAECMGNGSSSGHIAWTDTAGDAADEETTGRSTATGASSPSSTLMGLSQRSMSQYRESLEGASIDPSASSSTCSTTLGILVPDPMAVSVPNEAPARPTDTHDRQYRSNSSSSVGGWSPELPMISYSTSSTPVPRIHSPGSTSLSGKQQVQSSPAGTAINMGSGSVHVGLHIQHNTMAGLSASLSTLEHLLGFDGPLVGHTGKPSSRARLAYNGMQQYQQQYQRSSSSSPVPSTLPLGGGAAFSKAPLRPSTGMHASDMRGASQPVSHTGSVVMQPSSSTPTTSNTSNLLTALSEPVPTTHQSTTHNTPGLSNTRVGGLGPPVALLAPLSNTHKVGIAGDYGVGNKMRGGKTRSIAALRAGGRRA